MATKKVPIYKYVITLKNSPDGQRQPLRTAEAMFYREQDEFFCFDDTKVTVYQVRRELVDEIACDGRPVAEQEIDEPEVRNPASMAVPMGGWN